MWQESAGTGEGQRNRVSEIYIERRLISILIVTVV